VCCVMLDVYLDVAYDGLFAGVLHDVGLSSSVLHVCSIVLCIGVVCDAGLCMECF
jgi:hypothetical protein